MNFIYFSWLFIGLACLMFLGYEFFLVDRDYEIKRLKKIIKQKNKEIKELERISRFVYLQYIENKRK